jgi:uncharacterized protein (TIGR00297 family)
MPPRLARWGPTEPGPLAALDGLTVGRLLASAALGGGIASVAFWRRALTLDGAVAAAVVGALVFFKGGLPAAASLLAFFGSSSALSRLGQSRKVSGPLAQAKGARRDAWQVLANGGVATACIVFGQPAAFLGSLAAAGADTWATELGMLAGRRPRLITTLRPVAPGTSGGITPEGLAASLAGAVVVGVAWWLCGGRGADVRVAVIAGASGSLVDSVVGATLQALYRCEACGAPTEQPRHTSCDQPARLVRGYAWITNDTVNALATLTGAAVGSLATRPKT